MLSDDRPKRKSFPKNAFVESGSEVDEAFDLPAKAGTKRSATVSKPDEDEDFQLAIELSKESPKLKRRSRPSFVFDESEPIVEPSAGPIKDHVMEDEEEEEEEVFEDAGHDLTEESGVESDEAFEDSDEEEVEVVKPKKGKKSVTPSKPPATSKKATPVSKKPSAPKKAIAATKASTAITPKATSSIQPARAKPSFPAPSGVTITQGGPVRRVGLSKSHAPKGPLSPFADEKGRRSTVDDPPRGRRHQRSNAEIQEAIESQRNSRSNLAEEAHNNVDNTPMASSEMKGKGKPLKKTDSTWISSTPITRDGLEKQRGEFWETASEFGGKAEVWTALKSAIDTWDKDLELARAIIDCAGIVLPTGLLDEVYDESGFKYVIPDYCLSLPTNMTEDVNGSSSRLTVKRSPGLRSSSFSEDPQAVNVRNIVVRLNSGKDVIVDLKPSMKTIKDLSQATEKHGQLKIESGQRILFFYAGRGPLPADTKLDDLEKLDSRTPIQAWIS